MVNEKVIVKRLASIENLGSMNVLCSDKTGTLTIGEVKLQSAIDLEGNPSNKVLLYAYLNAVFETGFANPIDKAIRDFCSDQFDISSRYSKLDEIPYDFIRKRISILVSYSDETKTKTPKSFIVTKGAIQNMLEICSYVEGPNEKIFDISTFKDRIQQKFEEIGNKGFRILGVCYRNMVVCNDDHYNNDSTLHPPITKQNEIDMTFLGFIIFFDPIKPDVTESISNLKRLGIYHLR
jgi:Mg2+-importing ATPase